MVSALEQALLHYIRAMQLPIPEQEHRFAPPRRFRFDFAWPEQKLAVEIEGGTWGKSRHTTGKGYGKDCEKYNLAVLMGWRVLRFTGDMVKSGEAIEVIRRAIEIRSAA